MKLPDHKTQIVCTIGPASRSESMLKVLLEKGMNVARLNFSHGTFGEHQETIRRIRAVVKDLQCVWSSQNASRLKKGDGQIP